MLCRETPVLRCDIDARGRSSKRLHARNSNRGAAALLVRVVCKSATGTLAPRLDAVDGLSSCANGAESIVMIASPQPKVAFALTTRRQDADVLIVLLLSSYPDRAWLRAASVDHNVSTGSVPATSCHPLISFLRDQLFVTQQAQSLQGLADFLSCAARSRCPTAPSLQHGAREHGVSPGEVQTGEQHLCRTAVSLATTLTMFLHCGAAGHPERQLLGWTLVSGGEHQSRETGNAFM